MKLIWSIPFFRVFGIRVELHLTFLLFLGVVAIRGHWDAGLAGAGYYLLGFLLSFGSVLLHELGHCLAARHYGIRTSRILMMPIGGMAQFESLTRHPIKEFLITAAGPAVNFALALLLLPFIQWPVTAFWQADLVTYLFTFNLLMGCFNLLPIYPMDGGRLLRALIATQITYARSTHWALWVAKPLAVAGMMAGLFWLDNYLLAVLFAFILVCGDLEYHHIRTHEMMRGLFVRDITQRLCLVLPQSASVQEGRKLMEEHGEQPILVTREDGSLAGIAQPVQLRRGMAELPMGDLQLDRPHVLQEDWPLEVFGKIILKSEDGLIPVYRVNKLVGVVDTRCFRESIYRDILEERLRPQLAATPPAATNIHAELKHCKADDRPQRERR